MTQHQAKLDNIQALIQEHENEQEQEILSKENQRLTSDWESLVKEREKLSKSYSKLQESSIKEQEKFQSRIDQLESGLANIPTTSDTDRESLQKELETAKGTLTQLQEGNKELEQAQVNAKEATERVQDKRDFRGLSGLEISITYLADHPILLAKAEKVEERLKSLGMKVEMNSLPSTQFIQVRELFHDGEFRFVPTKGNYELLVAALEGILNVKPAPREYGSDLSARLFILPKNDR